MGDYKNGSAHIKRAKDGIHIDIEFQNLIVRMTKEQAHTMGIALLGMSMPQEEATHD